MSPDWIETKTARLLRKARTCGFFQDVIRDAERFSEDGYVWDVALMLSLRYWAGNPITGEVTGV
jgi:hypothetical protein